MPSPTKTIRIRPGSALERLTAQKDDFTAAVHHIAEVLELAMEQEAFAHRRDLVQEPVRDVFVPLVPGLPPKLEPPGWDQPEITDERLALAAVAEQVPAGLEPVIVEHEGDDPEDEDLSDLA